MRKKFLVSFVIAILIGVTAFAGMQTVNVEGKLNDLIKGIKNQALSTAINIGNLEQDARDIVSAYGSDIEAADKTKLQGLATEVTNAKNALTSLNDYIEANWSSIR